MKILDYIFYKFSKGFKDDMHSRWGPRWGPIVLLLFFLIANSVLIGHFYLDWSAEMMRGYSITIGIIQSLVIYFRYTEKRLRELRQKYRNESQGQKDLGNFLVWGIFLLPFLILLWKFFKSA